MLFIFDLDGTLCLDGQTISEEIKSALQLANHHGHQLAFASARSYRDCIGVLGDELSTETVIGLNGGLAYQEKKLTYHRRLDQEAYQVILSWCREYNLPFFVDDDFDYASEQFERIPFHQYVDPLGLGSRLEVDKLENPIKVVIELSRHEDLVEDMISDLTALGSLDIFYHEGEKCLYINPFETTKATAIQEIFGQDFVAFGNDKNDIEMFKASIYSVQIGDYKSLNDYADEILPADSFIIAEKIKVLFDHF